LKGSVLLVTGSESHGTSYIIFNANYD